MSLSEYLLSPDVLTQLGVAVFTVMYVMSAYLFLTKKRNLRTERNRQFWDALDNGFHSELLQTFDDVANVYKGIFGLSGDDQTYKAQLSKELRKYLAHVVSNATLAKELRVTVKEKVANLIETIEEESPYAELPIAERNLFSDITKFVDLGDNQSALEKLKDLAGLVEVRQELLTKMEVSNKWAIPLAAIGLILTIIFGLVSLFK